MQTSCLCYDATNRSSTLKNILFNLELIWYGHNMYYHFPHNSVRGVLMRLWFLSTYLTSKTRLCYLWEPSYTPSHVSYFQTMSHESWPIPSKSKRTLTGSMRWCRFLAYNKPKRSLIYPTTCLTSKRRLCYLWEPLIDPISRPLRLKAAAAIQHGLLLPSE